MRSSGCVEWFAGHSSVRFNSNSRNARIARANGHSTAHVYTEAHALACTLHATGGSANTHADLCLNANTHTSSYLNASPYFYAYSHSHAHSHACTNASTHTCTSAHSNADARTATNAYPCTDANTTGRFAGVRPGLNQ